MFGLRNAVLAFSMLAVFCSASFAEEWEKYDQPVPTKVVVRVLSHGAKAMNQKTGAIVVIYDETTGKEVDRGTVQGSTGDTDGIMRAGYPRMFGQNGMLKGEKGLIFEKAAPSRGSKYFDLRDTLTPDVKPVVYEVKDDTAKYEATIEISKPTRITVKAAGPLMPPHAQATATQTFWLLPGEDITGEGIVLDLRGLTVDVQASLRDSELKADVLGGSIGVPFYMTMLCGCPIAPAGQFPWEAEDYKIITQAYYKGKLYHEETTTADKLFRQVSAFMASVPLPKDLPEGPYKREKVKIRVMAAQNSQNNFGMDEFFVYLSK